MILDPHTAPDAAPAYALHTTRTLAVTRADGQAYLLYVSWPDGPAPAAGWPVVYMLDGETFAIAREIMRYQLGTGPQPLALPRLLVAIGYPGANRRHIDYALTGVDGSQPFRQFLLDDVLPLIQRTFSVDASRQTLMGHSLGGLFVLETLFQQWAAPGRGVFQRYVASSPSVWWQDGHLPARAARFVAQQAAASAHSDSAATPHRSAKPIDDDSSDAACSEAGHPLIKVQLSAAQYDEALSPQECALPDAARDALARTRQARAMVTGTLALSELLNRVPGLSVSFQVFDQETHRSVWPRAITHAMRQT